MINAVKCLELNQFDNTFWGVEGGAVEQLKCKVHMVIQGHRKIGPEADTRIIPKQKKSSPNLDMHSSLKIKRFLYFLSTSQNVHKFLLNANWARFLGGSFRGRWSVSF